MRRGPQGPHELQTEPEGGHRGLLSHIQAATGRTPTPGMEGLGLVWEERGLWGLGRELTGVTLLCESRFFFQMEKSLCHQGRVGLGAELQSGLGSRPHLGEEGELSAGELTGARLRVFLEVFKSSRGEDTS